MFVILLLLGNKGSFADNEIVVEKQTSDFYVNDFANIFTEEQKQEMLSKAIELNDTYNGIQVVVSTVESLQDYDIEEYAHSMYNQYDIGKYSMGVLVLVSETDRDVRIEIGKKLKNYTNTRIPDLEGKIQSKLLDSYLKTDDLAQGTVVAQSKIINVIKENIPADWEEIDNRSINGMLIFFCALFTISIIIIIFLLFDKEDFKKLIKYNLSKKKK